MGSLLEALFYHRILILGLGAAMGTLLEIA
jgi:hypothetical protein